MHDLSQGITVVTGGAGLIGSATIWGLNNRNLNNIWAVDDCEAGTPKERNLHHLKSKIRSGVQLILEICFEKDSPKLKEVKTVIHLGACSSTTESNEEYLNDNNLSYTRELCQWAIKNGVRFVYASSASTYGDGSMGMDDEDKDIEKYQPLNLYGWSKQNFDLYAKQSGWLESIVGLKYFNVYGPNEEHKGNMRSVVSKAFEQINETGEMTLFKSHHPNYEDGKQMRGLSVMSKMRCV